MQGLKFTNKNKTKIYTVIFSNVLLEDSNKDEVFVVYRCNKKGCLYVKSVNDFKGSFSKLN